MPDPTYDPPVGGADNGGAPPPAPGGAPGVTPPSPSGPGATPPSPAPSGASPAANGQPGHNGEFVPRTRLNEVTERARQEIARRDAEITRLTAATKPAAPAAAPDPEAESIKQQFFKLFPAAEKLFGLPAEKLEQLLGTAPQLQAQTDHYWSVVGQSMLRQLHTSMEKVYGGSPDGRTRRWMEQAFIDWVGNDPAATQRYLSQDPQLVSDFWKLVETHMLDPIRRGAVVSEQRRADRRGRLPIPATGTQVQGTPMPKPKDEDELHDRAWAAYEAQR